MRTESNRSVPPTRNGLVRMACTMRDGISSLSRTARANRDQARAMFSSGSANATTPHPSIAWPMFASVEPGPMRDGLERAALHGVIAPLVPVRVPTGGVRAREHRGVLAGAVVVESRQPRARFAQQLHPARRQRVVRAAGEVALLESDVLEHRLRDRDVFGLAAMRRAGERQLIVAPMQLVESAGFDEPHRPGTASRTIATS